MAKRTLSNTGCRETASMAQFINYQYRELVWGRAKHWRELTNDAKLAILK